MTIMSNGTAAAPRDGHGPGRFGAWLSGAWAVVGMELRQRLRSRGWYIMLVVWMAVIAIVTAFTWSSWKAQSSYNNGDFGYVGPQLGSMIFEVVLAFVLLFALLVAPALSANAVNGDRAAGTLAILQVTLLRPGQLLWGKFLASWIAGLAFLVASLPFLVFAVLQGGLGAWQIVVALAMLAVEVGIVCAIGVGISALATRPLFSIVVTYMVVAALGLGTLVAFGLGSLVSEGTVEANQVYYKNAAAYQGSGDSSGDGEYVDGTYVDGGSPDLYPAPPQPKDITGQNAEYACFGPLVEQRAARTERVAWILGLNPFVVVADAIPFPLHAGDRSYSGGAFESISQGVRYLQAGPDATYQCAGGKVAPSYIEQKVPLWPLGLGLQLLVAAGILALGWRALRTPARRLPKGTRVA